MEAPLDEQRHAAAVIEVRVREQYQIYAGGIEPERVRVLFVKLASTLVHAAVDQDAPPATLDQVAGAGHAAIGAVE
jgi:hypothetical protein